MKKNIEELMRTKGSKTRRKAIRTIEKRTGLPFKAAKAKQAVAIAYAQKRRSK